MQMFSSEASMEGMNTNMNTHLQHLMATASRHPLHQQSNKGQTNLMQEVYYPWECEHVEYQMLSKYDSIIYSTIDQVKKAKYTVYPHFF